MQTAGRSHFTVESHVRFLDEVKASEQLRVMTKVLGSAGKNLGHDRWRAFRHGGEIPVGQHRQNATTKTGEGPLKSSLYDIA